MITEQEKIEFGDYVITISTNSECRCDDCYEAARDDYYEALAEERRQERRHGGG